MASKFRPMLAGLAPEHTDQLSYPLYASPKLDGIRCVIKDGQALSRSLKPIPNEHIQQQLSNRPELEGFDGELIIGEPNHPDVFNRSTSAVRRASGTPDFAFWVFDLVLPDVPFEQRYQELRNRHLEICQTSLGGREVVKLLSQERVDSPYGLEEFERDALARGYEGAITRHPYGLYKFGRSTVKQEWLLKIKRFIDEEAEVIGFLEEMHNENEKVTNELGLSERSSHKDNKVGKGTMGVMVCRNENWPEIRIGTGFTADQRRVFWNQRQHIEGKTVTFKYFKHGSIDAPRHPVFKGFRMEEDQ
jgi:DNA ligase-1